MHRAERQSDTIGRLYEIINVAKVGTAVTVSKLNIMHVDDAQRSLFKVIYRLASEGVDLAEAGRRLTGAAAKAA